LVLAGCLVLSGVARADDPPASADPPPPAASEPAPAPAPSGDELGFDLFDAPKKSLAEEEADQARAARILKETQVRRRVLTAHLGVGIATLGLLAATLVLGTLNYVDKFEEGSTGRYNLPHLAFASISSAAFTTTAILGLAAPVPYKKPIRADAALAHKVLMGFAAACFAANLIMGPISVARAGTLDQRPFAQAHLAVGYGAFAFMGGGVLAWVFK
jgi:hypothetical protein